MERIERIVSKLHLDRFFSSKLILAIDLVISLGASVASLIFERLLISDSVITDGFILSWVGLSVVFSLISFLTFKTYRVIVRHTTLKEFARICLASFAKSLGVGLFMMALPFKDTYYGLLVILDCSFTIAFLLMVRVAMIIAYDVLREKVISSRKRMNVMVYGVDDKSVGVVTRLINSPHYNVIGYLNYGQRLRDRR